MSTHHLTISRKDLTALYYDLREIAESDGSPEINQEELKHIRQKLGEKKYLAYDPSCDPDVLKTNPDDWGYQVPPHCLEAKEIGFLPTATDLNIPGARRLMTNLERFLATSPQEYKLDCPSKTPTGPILLVPPLDSDTLRKILPFPPDPVSVKEAEGCRLTPIDSVLYYLTINQKNNEVTIEIDD